MRAITTYVEHRTGAPRVPRSGLRRAPEFIAPTSRRRSERGRRARPGRLRAHRPGRRRRARCGRAAGRRPPDDARGAIGVQPGGRRPRSTRWSPRRTRSQGTRQADGSVVFTWENPEPQEGDRYLWGVLGRPASPSSSSSAPTVTVPPTAGPARSASRSRSSVQTAVCRPTRRRGARHEVRQGPLEDHHHRRGRDGARARRGARAGRPGLPARAPRPQRRRRVADGHEPEPARAVQRPGRGAQRRPGRGGRDVRRPAGRG